jgi:hypothetical protein
MSPGPLQLPVAKGFDFSAFFFIVVLTVIVT